MVKWQGYDFHTVAFWGPFTNRNSIMDKWYIDYKIWDEITDNFFQTSKHTWSLGMYM